MRNALILALIGFVDILVGCKKSPPAKPVTFAIFEVVDCASGRDRLQVRGRRARYYISSSPVVTEKDIAAAESAHDQLDQPVLNVYFRRAGGEQLLATTLRLSAEPDKARLAIVIDGELIMAPGAKGVVADGIMIGGGLREEDTERLAASLNANREELT